MATLFENKNYLCVANTESYKSGYIDSDITGLRDYWLMYDNGQVVYDFPEKCPKYVKNAIVKWLADMHSDTHYIFKMRNNTLALIRKGDKERENTILMYNSWID